MIPKLDDDQLAVLRYQRLRGPLPETPAGLAVWIACVRDALPEATIEVAREAVDPLRAFGVPVEQLGDRALALLPPDGDLIDRVLLLAGAPAIPGGAARALLSLTVARKTTPSLPTRSLPLRVQPPRASSLGWSPELCFVTVLLSNASIRKDDAALVGGEGPVVAVCAEYDRALVSLDPPSVADWQLGKAREHGVPTIRLSSGWFASPVRLEATSPSARALPNREDALARASRFLREVDDAWKRRSGPPLAVAWPVYRSLHGGPLLDAVMGRPLPELQTP